MRFSRATAAAAALTTLPVALAQTSTTCNPTEKSCPEDTGLDASTFKTDFTQGADTNSWSSAEATTLTYGNQGAAFSIAQAGQAPTLSTNFYFLFGRVDVKMQAAPGVGIVSSVVLESDDLDEIDWEFLGGDTTQVQANYFGKGNTTSYDRATYQPVSTPQTTTHTYSVDWTSDRIEWIIDGTTVRTLSSSDPQTIGGQNYPQTPMRLKLGNWCGGCAGEPEGTVEWAGGQTTFEGAPYVMYVDSVSITNYNPAKSYKYGDLSGSWESIEIVNGSSSASASGSAVVSATSASSVPSSSPSSSPGSSSGSSSGSSWITSAPASSTSLAGVGGQTGAGASATVTGTGAATRTGAPYGSNSTAATGTGTAASDVSSGSPTTSGQFIQTGTSAATANQVVAAGSFMGIALSFLML